MVRKIPKDRCSEEGTRKRKGMAVDTSEPPLAEENGCGCEEDRGERYGG